MMHFPLRFAPLGIERDLKLTSIFTDQRAGLANYPAINGLLDRVVSRPAFKRAMARAMPNGPPAM
jgi:hypothetical protein